MTTRTQKNTKILQGDCIEVLKRLPSNSIDLVLTDPPYLVNYRARDGRRIKNDSNGAWMKPAFREIARVLKNNKFCISFYGWQRAEEFLTTWKSVGLYPVGHLVWFKSYASSTKFLRRLHECAYLLAKGSPTYPPVLLNDILPWSYTGNRLHPNQKPLSAIEPLVAAFSSRGDVILDPFMGSGTTGRAALRLQRRFVGIELDPRYFEVARQRLERQG